MTRTPAALLFVLLAASLASAQQPSPAPTPRWFKGNTHSHARILWPIPHGDSTPKRLARWYQKQGYNFLCISDHNRVGRERRAKKVETKSFILISGVEVTSDTRVRVIYKARNKNAPTRVVHSTAFNIDPKTFDKKVANDFGPTSSILDILKKHRAATRRAGGISILNHPNFRDPITAQDIIGSGMKMFEVYNAYPHSKNFGSSRHPTTEQLWDQVLSTGRQLYGVASDDAHHTKRWNRKLKERMGIRAPAGGGWVMVRAARLTPGAIAAAMAAGEFYASSGVHLRTLEVNRTAGTVEVAVDVARTRAEIAKAHVAAPARAVTGSSTRKGTRITFITQNGRVLRTIDADRATVRLSSATGYVRARVRYVAGKKEFFAWTQPVFVRQGAAGALTRNP